MPDAVRGKMEAALGADFSNVRVHVGPQAERIGAIAFTVGSDIYFAPGRFQPDTVHGQQLLGHELAHAVQQRTGRVRNPLGSGLAVVQDHALEAEADRLGHRAAAHRVAAQPKLAPGAVQPSAPVRISPPIGIGPGSYRLTAGAGGRQVGSVMVHARDKGAVEVTDLGVDQSQRGHGIGQMLVASAAKTGLQFGKSKVTLAAQDKGSGHLTHWYKQMGFTQTGMNQRGYPQLEAPISRVLAGVAQNRPLATITKPASVQSATLKERGTREHQVGTKASQLPANLASFGPGGGQRLPEPVRQKMPSTLREGFLAQRAAVPPKFFDTLRLYRPSAPPLPASRLQRQIQAKPLLVIQPAEAYRESGLNKPAAMDRFARKIVSREHGKRNPMGSEKLWRNPDPNAHSPGLTEPQRRGKLLKYLNAELQKANVPPLKGLKADYNNAVYANATGVFDHSTWTLELYGVCDLTDPDNIDYEELVKTVYHETRHCEQRFRAARYLAGEGWKTDAIRVEMDMPVDVAQAAKDRPLKFPGNRTNRQNTKYTEAKIWYDSFGATGRTHQHQVKTLTDLSNLPNDPSVNAAYLALPEEADAFHVEQRAYDVLSQIW